MSQIKIVTAPRIAEGNVKKGGSLYADLESKLNKATEEGWEVVGAGPDREVLIKKGMIIELLRKIPVVSILIDWLLPLKVKLTISVILKKD